MYNVSFLLSVFGGTNFAMGLPHDILNKICEIAQEKTYKEYEADITGKLVCELGGLRAIADQCWNSINLDNLYEYLHNPAALDVISGVEEYLSGTVLSVIGLWLTVLDLESLYALEFMKRIMLYYSDNCEKMPRCQCIAEKLKETWLSIGFGDHYHIYNGLVRAGHKLTRENFDKAFDKWTSVYCDDICRVL